MPARAVFFDFGGTLFSYGDVQGRTFYPILLESLGRLGAECEPREAGRAYRRASAAAFAAHHERDYYLHKDLFQDVFRRFAEQVGGSASDDDLEWFHDAQRRMVYEGFALRNDCKATLDALRAAGLHVAIVSNIDDDYLLPMVEKSGLGAHLDAWTSSEEARSCKPHRGIYEHAQRKAGDVSAAESVFVGDSRAHDIVGARALGMHTILIEEGGVETPGGDAGQVAEPHHRVAALGEIPAIVRRLASA